MKIELTEKKILVTGASGSLGSQLLYLLHKQGIKPIAHVRETSDTSFIDSLGLEKRVVDLRRKDKMPDLMSGIDLVIHTAAYVDFRQDRLTQFTGTNTIAALDLFKAASRAGVERFLHISTVAAVGGVNLVDNNTQLDAINCNEQTQFNLDHLHIPYIMTKRAAEVELYKEAKNSKTELVIANPSVILAPSQTLSDRDRAMQLFGRFFFPSLSNRFNIVDLRDVADGIIFALSKGADGQRYILGGHNISIKNFVSMVSSELDISPNFIRIPRKIIDFSARFSERYGKIRGKSKISYYPDLVKMLDYDWAFSSKKAEVELGYTCRPLDVSLKELLDGNMTGTYLKP